MKVFAVWDVATGREDDAVNCVAGSAAGIAAKYAEYLDRLDGQIGEPRRPWHIIGVRKLGTDGSVRYSINADERGRYVATLITTP